MLTGLFEGAFGRVRQFACGLHGHDVLLHFEHERISLQCTSCGYETPGWDVKAVERTPLRAESRREPATVVRMPLVHERRVA